MIFTVNSNFLVIQNHCTGCRKLCIISPRCASGLSTLSSIVLGLFPLCVFVLGQTVSMQMTDWWDRTQDSRARCKPKHSQLDSRLIVFGNNPIAVSAPVSVVFFQMQVESSVELVLAPLFHTNTSSKMIQQDHKHWTHTGYEQTHTYTGHQRCGEMDRLQLPPLWD